MKKETKEKARRMMYDCTESGYRKKWSTMAR
jgi:hypothetical protein